MKYYSEESIQQWASEHDIDEEAAVMEKHRQGTLTYADGDEYVGEFRDGLANGQGTLTFGPSSQFAGDKYVGEFRDGKRHGQGTYTYADGEVWEGIWKNDEYDSRHQHADRRPC